METVLNLSPTIASIYIRHPIICQICPDMSDETVRRYSRRLLIIKSEKFPDDQSLSLQGQLMLRITAFNSRAPESNQTKTRKWNKGSEEHGFCTKIHELQDFWNLSNEMTKTKDVFKLSAED